MSVPRRRTRGWIIGWMTMVVLVTFAAAITRPLQAQSLDDARDSIRAGRYESAMAILSKIPRADSTWIDAQRELARTLALMGRYDQAENVAPAAV